VFHVILWDTTSDGRKVADALQNENVALHLISRILPDYEHRPERYRLHPHDLHPNAFVHRRIAAYVADNILRRDRHASGRPFTLRSGPDPRTPVDRARAFSRWSGS
jgi:hypothetical protein